MYHNRGSATTILLTVFSDKIKLISKPMGHGLLVKIELITKMMGF